MMRQRQPCHIVWYIVQSAAFSGSPQSETTLFFQRFAFTGTTGRTHTQGAACTLTAAWAEPLEDGQNCMRQFYSWPLAPQEDEGGDKTM